MANNKKRPAGRTAAGRTAAGRAGGSGRARTPAEATDPDGLEAPANDAVDTEDTVETARPPEIAPANEPPAKPTPARQPVRPATRPPAVAAKGPSAEAAAKRQELRAAARIKREEALRRRQAAERKRKVRNVSIIGVIVLLIGALVTFGIVHSKANQKAFAQLSAAAGCTSVQNTDPGANTLSHAHLTATQTVTYSTSPPSGGAHNPVPLPSGVYPELSTNPTAQPNIYQAVHSLEHGYVIVWYKNASDLSTLSSITNPNTFKTIVTAYPSLPTGTVGLTAWGRLQYCNKVNTDQIHKFISLYQLKTASEPNAA